MDYLLGYDIGSSSIKASLLEVEGKLTAAAASPRTELAISAKQPGWAKHDPYTWWEHLKIATTELLRKSEVKPENIKAIGKDNNQH